MKLNLKEEFTSLAGAVKSLNKKITVILLSVAVLQTVSWYLTSRQFFRNNFYYTIFDGNTNADVYEFIYWFAGDFITFFICGLLIIKLFFRENLKDYGVNFGSFSLGIKISLISIAVMSVVIWFVSASNSFSESYPLLERSKYDWGVFLIFQAFLLLFLFAWEFFWRGFMLFGLKKEFGYYAVLLQMIPFVILHNGKPFLETFGAIGGAIALGIIAYRTGSFLYGVIIHYAVYFMLDFLSILRFRTGISGSGLNSFFQIISKLF